MTEVARRLKVSRSALYAALAAEKSGRTQDPSPVVKAAAE
jgi:DNA-binding phage protein